MGLGTRQPLPEESIGVRENQVHNGTKPSVRDGAYFVTEDEVFCFGNHCFLHDLLEAEAHQA